MPECERARVKLPRVSAVGHCAQLPASRGFLHHVVYSAPCAHGVALGKGHRQLLVRLHEEGGRRLRPRLVCEKLVAAIRCSTLRLEAVRLYVGG